MELKPTTGERCASVTQIYLDFAKDYPHLEASVERRTKLIRHLEENVDGPPQWVTVSMSRGCFYITETDTYEPLNARVEIYQYAEFYEIRYRMPEEQEPWCGSFGAWVLGQTTDVEEAGRMVKIALTNAALNLPKSRQEWRERYGAS